MSPSKPIPFPKKKVLLAKARTAVDVFVSFEYNLGSAVPSY